MDDEEISNPTVKSAIADDSAVIEGRGSREAKNLAGLINEGALPVTVKEVSIDNVGAQLGAEALPNSIKEGLIGIAIIFMITYYRVLGIVSCFVLTLSGIAVSMFAAIVVIKTLMKWVVNMGMLK